MATKKETPAVEKIEVIEKNTPEQKVEVKEKSDISKLADAISEATGENKKKKPTFGDKIVNPPLARTHIEEKDGEVYVVEHEILPASYKGKKGVKEHQQGNQTIYYRDIPTKRFSDNVVKTPKS